MFEFKMYFGIKIYWKVFCESSLYMMLGRKPSILLNWHVGSCFILICGGSSDYYRGAQLRQEIIIDGMNV